MRAHRLAAGAPTAPTWDGDDEPSDHALGRSVGGFSIKIHVLSDGNGLPLDAIVTPGQTHESTQFERVLTHVAIPRASGRTRRRPRTLAADRAYDARRIRQWLRAHGIQPVIPPKRRCGRVKPGRPVTYDAVAYRRRSTIEQCIGWMKECRAVAMRYEKLALNYLGLVKLAFIERYLRLLTRPAVAVSIRYRIVRKSLIQIALTSDIFMRTPDPAKISVLFQCSSLSLNSPMYYLTPAELPAVVQQVIALVPLEE